MLESRKDENVWQTNGTRQHEREECLGAAEKAWQVCTFLILFSRGYVCTFSASPLWR